MEQLTFPVSPDPPCGCDERTGAGGLMPVEQALARALSLSRPGATTETVALQDAVGRVLSEEVLAPFPLPPFDNSAMDGYAVRTSDMTGSGPWKLTVAGRVAAGDDPGAVGVFAPGQVLRIFTGAAIPDGADAVVMQERVTRTGDVIEIVERPGPGSCIRRAGEDARQGTQLLPAGKVIGAREAGAIASVGMPEVRVRRKVRIALLCTGNELRQPGMSIGPGQIYNSNRFMMLAALRQPWAEITDCGAVADNPDLLREALLGAAERSDMVVTTGGVSVGDEDHVVEQLRHAGGRIDVLRIAMKPGKPLMLGTLGRSVIVGLPGNPVAAFATWKVIGARMAERIAGQTSIDRLRHYAVVTGTVTRRPGRQEYRPARIVGTGPDGQSRIELLDASFSAKISRLCTADGFAVIPARAETVATGEKLEFLYI